MTWENRLRWEDNLITDIKEMGMREWAGFIWHRIGTSRGLLRTRVPWKFINFLAIFSRRILIQGVI
jgi:hypothetical protein